MTSNRTLRLTSAQALVLYLSKQYSVVDGDRRRLIPAAMGIFGHGNVAGLGQAFDQYSDGPALHPGPQRAGAGAHRLGVREGLHATRRARRHRVDRPRRAQHGHRRRRWRPSTGCPCCCCPGDTYATRRQGPVLQQLQHPVEADASVNDAFRPVSRFFDRITRPEQLLTALPAAMRVLVDPGRTPAPWCCPCPRTSSRTPTTTRPSSSPSATGPSAGRCPSRPRSTAVVELVKQASQAADHRRRRRASTPTPSAELERTRRRGRHPGRRDLRRQGRRPAPSLVAARRHRPRGQPGDERGRPRTPTS